VEWKRSDTDKSEGLAGDSGWPFSLGKSATPKKLLASSPFFVLL
jgi:hypothetical protein